MREILFRGKRTEYSGWLYGIPDNEDHNADFPCIIPNKAFYTTDDYPLDWEVDPETIGQFTGLTDISGKRIFEGDIMKTSITGLTQHTGVVEFADGSFGLKCTDGGAYYLCYVAGSYAVIGNIYDNPELLEGE